MCIIRTNFRQNKSCLSNAYVIYVSTLIPKTQLLLQVLLLTFRCYLLESICQVEMALTSKDLAGQDKITGKNLFTSFDNSKKKKNWNLFLVCMFFIAHTKSLMHSDETSVVYYTGIALGCAAIAYIPREKMQLLVLLSLFISC